MTWHNLFLICASLIMMHGLLQFFVSYRNAWFVIDLGVFVIPSSYTLRHARGYGR